MKRVYLAGIVLGGLFGIACVEAPVSKSLPMKDDDMTTAPPEREDRELESSPSEDPSYEDTDYGSDAAASSPDASSDASGEQPCKKSWWGTCVDAGPSAEHTASCTATNDGHKSVSIVSYNDSAGTIEIVSISTLVTNKNKHDGNRVAVLTKPKTLVSYTEAFSTGETVPTGKTVALPVPAAFQMAPGTGLRIDTTFDDSTGDRTGSCYLQL